LNFLNPLNPLNPSPSPFPLLDHVVPECELASAAAGYARDTITLGWEDRRQTQEGDCLVFDALRLVVRVVERPEAVFVIEPRTPQEWALYAYHIGNRHQPAMITSRAIVCPDVPGVEQLLEQIHVPYTRATLPFTPATTPASHHHATS
jgi:urease accessory protein UreE